MTDPYPSSFLSALLRYGGIEVDDLVASTHADEISRLALLNEKIAALNLANPIPDSTPWEPE